MFVRFIGQTQDNDRDRIVFTGSQCNLGSARRHHKMICIIVIGSGVSTRQDLLVGSLGVSHLQEETFY